MGFNRQHVQDELQCLMSRSCKSNEQCHRSHIHALLSALNTSFVQLLATEFLGYQLGTTKFQGL